MLLLAWTFNPSSSFPIRWSSSILSSDFLHLWFSGLSFPLLEAFWILFSMIFKGISVWRWILEMVRRGFWKVWYLYILGILVQGCEGKSMLYPCTLPGLFSSGTFIEECSCRSQNKFYCAINDIIEAVEYYTFHEVTEICGKIDPDVMSFCLIKGSKGDIVI